MDNTILKFYKFRYPFDNLFAEGVIFCGTNSVLIYTSVYLFYLKFVATRSLPPLRPTSHPQLCVVSFRQIAGDLWLLYKGLTKQTRVFYFLCLPSSRRGFLVFHLCLSMTIEQWIHDERCLLPFYCFARPSKTGFILFCWLWEKSFIYVMYWTLVLKTKT